MKRFFITITLLIACASFFSSCNQKAEEPRAKYIFLMIGDGMGASHVAAAEAYMSYQAGKLGGEQLVMTTFPVLGMCTTYSNSNNITDSAASGTAIATGHKTNNGMLGVDPDAQPLYSMAYALKEEGYKIGIMSSVPVNHATPAAFYGHQIKRNMYYEIGLEIPATNFEFLAGSGILDVRGKKGDLESLDQVLAREGYPVCYGLAELAECEDRDGIVLVQESAKKEVLNYEIEREAKEDRLGEIMAAAIDFLGDEQPFFIMCEGGEIDWCGHANTTMSMIDAIQRFDEAVAVAYEFYLKHPDETLIVVTADHETGGLALGQKGYWIDWEGFEKDIKEGVKDSRELSQAHGIGWTSYDHTGAPVPVYAIGKGAERFAGRLDNEDIFGKIVCE